MNKFKYLKTALLLGALAILLVVAIVVSIFDVGELYTVESVGAWRGEVQPAENAAFESLKLRDKTVQAKLTETYREEQDGGSAYVTRRYIDEDGSTVYKLDSESRFWVEAGFRDGKQVPLAEYPYKSVDENSLHDLAEAYIKEYHEEGVAYFDEYDIRRPSFTTEYYTSDRLICKTGLYPPPEDEQYAGFCYRLKYALSVGGTMTAPLIAVTFDGDGNIIAYEENRRDVNWNEADIDVDVQRLYKSIEKFYQKAENQVLSLTSAGKLKFSDYEIVDKELCFENGAYYLCLRVNVWYRYQFSLTRAYSALGEELRVKLEP